MTNAVSARIASFGSGRFSSSTLPSAIADLQHRVRPHAHALVREHRVGARHLDQRRLGRAEGDRQIGRQRRLEAEPPGVGDHLAGPELVHDADGGHVARLLECAAQRDRALELAVVVERRVGGLAGAAGKADRRVHQERDRRVAAVDRRGVDERLEGRADLAVGLRRAVELAALEAVAADHRQDLAGAVVDDEHGAFDLRRLLERAGGRRRAVDASAAASRSDRRASRAAPATSCRSRHSPCGRW